MEVSFRTARLRRSYEESARAVKQWGPTVGRKYVTRINQLYAVRDLQEAYNIRSLRLHPLKGAREGELSIYLTGRWRLIVTKADTEESVIIREVSNHYDD